MASFLGENPLQKLGLIMSGIASTTSRDPRYLQTNLVMQDALQEMRDRERAEAEQAKQDLLLRRLMNPSSRDMIGTPATKAFTVNGRTIGQNAPAQTAPVMPDDVRLRSLQRALPREFLAAELQQRLSGPAKPVALGERERLVDPVTHETLIDALPTQEGPSTEIGKLLAERDALPIGSPLRRLYDSQLANITQPKNETRGMGQIFEDMFGGKVESGMRPVVGADGMPTGEQEPIPGGEKDPRIIEAERQKKLMELAPKEKIAVDVATQFYDTAIKQIDKILANPNTSDVIGGWEGSFEPSGFISPKNREALSDIETLDDMLQVKGLEMMRASSPTGGAVGSVTEREWPKLSARFGNLRRTQSERDYFANLRAIKADLESAKNNTLSAYNSTYGPRQKGAPLIQSNDINALLDKYAPR